MFEDKARLLLILSRDALDRARVLAGKATTALKLPVSLQIVLRALIGVGLKRENHPALLASITSQARALREKRTETRRADVSEALPGRRRKSGRNLRSVTSTTSVR